MMEWVEFTAKTVSDAVTEASIKFEVTSDMLEYEVIEVEKSGFLGLFSKPAKIRARKKSAESKKAEPVVKKEEKKHVGKKIFGVFFFALLLAVVAYLSGCHDFYTTFIHVFIIFAVVNLYDMIVLDWGVFCHSKRLRIPGTEDMDADYKDYLFHAKGAMIGMALGVIVAVLAGILVWIYGNVFDLS